MCYARREEGLCQGPVAERTDGHGAKGSPVCLEHRVKGSVAFVEAKKEVARPCMDLQYLLMISAFIPRLVGRHYIY